MARIRPYTSYDTNLAVCMLVHHRFWGDHFSPGAYHTLWPYGWDEGHPAADAWQVYPTLALGRVAAIAWASRPAMVNHLCVVCRSYKYPLRLPRWNIYRGETHPIYHQAATAYPPRILPCFVQRSWDPPPPGYGPDP